LHKGDSDDDNNNSSSSGQERLLQYQAGGTVTYAVIGGMDWMCRKDERRCQGGFLIMYCNCKNGETFGVKQRRPV
jgi:hypothetical protein